MRPMKNVLIVGFVFQFLIIAACASAKTVDLAPDEAKAFAREAFFWGMHQVAYYHFRHNYVQNEKAPTYVGLNRINWNRKPITAAFRAATTPNATTMYGIGIYDLRDGPIVVDIPAIEGYWSLQVTDQYARWFLRVGNQWTGSEAQTVLVIGPDYQGPLPSGFIGSNIHRVPSNYLFLLFRLGLKSYAKEDVAAVNQRMDAITAVPLSLWEKGGRKTIAANDQPAVKGNYTTIPGMNEVKEPWNLEAGKFYQWVSLVINDPAMTKQKDSHKEVVALQEFAKLGLEEGAMFDYNAFTPEQQAAIDAGFQEAKKEASAAVHSMLIPMNKHQLSTDYNYDETNWVLRAGYGILAIAAPVPAYSHTGTFSFVDSEGRKLHGDHRYTLTFNMANLPPVTEFWSIPMYDLAGYFVDNPINRYTVNSFMLKNEDFHVADGKLTFYLQPEKPSDPEQAKNWLPTPKGEGFRMSPRFYGPEAPLIEGSYPMPLPVRVD